MTKRIAILAALVAVALTLAGCGFKPPVQWNETEERARALEAMNGWAEGVEDYNIDAMAGDGILAAGFKLYIYEGVILGTNGKEAPALRDDLNKDAADQASFREDKGYILRLDIDKDLTDAGYDEVNDWTIDSISKTNAKVLGRFEVFETADDLENVNGGRIVDGWWNSDNGSITVELVRTPNAWKIISMKIVFDAGTAAAACAQSDIVGLGIGKLRPTSW